MKKRSLLAVMIICLNLLILSSCGGEAKLTGTWQGDGSLDMLGMEAPWEYATQWVFRADGTVSVTVGEETVDFRYSTTDDTLTLNGEELSWGVLYRVKQDTLSIETGDGTAVFTKMK